VRRRGNPLIAWFKQGERETFRLKRKEATNTLEVEVGIIYFEVAQRWRHNFSGYKNSLLGSTGREEKEGKY